MPDRQGSENSRRHRLRFSVRGLITLVLLLGCGLGGVAHFIHQARVQRQTVAAIERAGGDVMYNTMWKNGDLVARAPGWPRWLENCFGIDFLGHVVFVRFPFDHEISDAELEMVGRLPRLEELESFQSSVVTDAGLAHIRELAVLKKLDLRGSKITDAGLIHLRGLTGLRELDLSNTDVTDAGLIHLRGLTGLRELDLNDTDVTGAGLIHLQELTGLQTLSLVNSDFREEGVTQLKKLTSLRSVDLSLTKCDDFTAQELRRALPTAKVVFTSIMAR